ncbi:MAG: formylglycine-generating enzyme family protein, partial [Planctomycetota bacterium]
MLLMLGFLGREGYGRVKSQGLVERLLDANSADVPTIVKEISGYRRWANTMLLAANNKAEQEKDERKQLHTSLALLPVDKTQITYLYSRLLGAKPNEADVLVISLGSYKDELVEQLWDVLLKPEKAKEMQVLRVASALAAYDGGVDIKNWEKISPLIVNQLVKENPAFIGVWTEALRPVKKFLVNPLTNTFNNRAPDKTLENSLATNLLADYAADQPEVLTSLILDADEKQFALLFPAIKEQSANCLLLLNAELNKPAPQNVNYALKEMDDKRKANALVALAKLNQPETIWPLLKHTSTPQSRSYLIEKLALHNLDYKVLLQQLKIEKEVSIRRALIQTLGNFDLGQISLEERITIFPYLEEIYLKESDPGIHASAEWLLRTWNQQSFINKTNESWQQDKELTLNRQKEITNRLDKEKENSLMQWYVNGQGQTMVVIPGPVEFLMGSPVSEVDHRYLELQHKRKIGRSFEISNKAVTLAQYQQFDAKYTQDAKYVRSGDLPVVAINYHMAAKYCNWLSKTEGIPEDQWCFEINKQDETIVKIDYLSLKGYRLPTEAEIEYATRAESISSYYFGDTLEILPKYAWFRENSKDQPWPVGSLKPNDFGLFDTHGNSFTWCMEEYGVYPVGTREDNLEGTKVLDISSRMLRGGSFNDGGSKARSSYRNISFSPIFRNNGYGFRLARTTDNAKLKEKEEAKAKQRELVKSGIEKEMVLIPAGKFKMGSPATEKGRSNNETPHEVTLTKPFYMAKYEITQEQYESVMGNNPSGTKGAKLPVASVSWEDCQEFINKLNAKTNGGYRLPTEAEWEYACRAGTTTAYSFGDEITPKDANYRVS